MTPARILVVDDERDIVWILRRALCDDGYDVVVANDGQQALALVRQQQPDLVVLDVIMPGMDGLEVCQRLRSDETLYNIPILLLTVRKDIEDRVRGLERGADDYLSKPFDLRELSLRVKALLRRSSTQASAGETTPDQGITVQIGPFELDVQAGTLRMGSVITQLTPIECDLLHLLMTHQHEVFASRQLLRLVWGFSQDLNDSSLVRWHIKNLREKIEPDPDQPRYLRTISHRGYVFSCPVS